MTTDIPPAGLRAGKSAIVTGAGTGIGRAIARVFVREGAQVLAVDFNPETLRDAAAEIGAESFQADISREADVDHGQPGLSSGRGLPSGTVVVQYPSVARTISVSSPRIMTSNVAC